jgi:hypothetical protein
MQRSSVLRHALQKRASEGRASEVQKKAAVERLQLYIY